MVTRLALLGAGRIGKVHAKAIAEDKRAKLVAVADAFADAANAIAAQTGCAVKTIEEIEADKDIDAVIICTPTNTHADLIERFAKAGKAIFCEKPIDLDVARAQACIDVVKETGAKVMLGFNRRFDPHFQAVRAEIDKGTIGKVEMVTITSRDPGAPPVEYIKVSGGIFRDMTIHDFDIARYFAGEIVEVQAFGANFVDPAIREAGDIDAAMVTMRAASGALVHINNSRRATYGYDQRLEVFGEKGMLIAGNRTATTVQSFSGAGTGQGDVVLPFFIERYAEAYAAEVGHFVESVAARTTPLTSFRDGAEALRLADAAFESLQTGRVVKLG